VSLHSDKQELKEFVMVKEWAEGQKAHLLRDPRLLSNRYFAVRHPWGSLVFWQWKHPVTWREGVKGFMERRGDLIEVERYFDLY
jgi:hypothetical protein